MSTSVGRRSHHHASTRNSSKDDFNPIKVKEEPASDNERGRDSDGDFRGSRRRRGERPGSDEDKRRSTSKKKNTIEEAHHRRSKDGLSHVKVKDEPVSDTDRDADGDLLMSSSSRRRKHSGTDEDVEKDRDGDFSGPRRRRDGGSRDRDGDFSGTRRRPRTEEVRRDEDGDLVVSRRRDRSRSKERYRDQQRGNYHGTDRSREDRGHYSRDRRRDYQSSSSSQAVKSKDEKDKDMDYNGRRRDPVREKEWEAFFNPNKNWKVEGEGEPENENDKYGMVKRNSDDGPPAPKVEKEKPNFGLSGKLTEETNTFRGVAIKYSEPPEARKPQKIRWRLYPFKGDEQLEVMFIHRQSAYLLGRDRKVADIPIDHPSCSKQHAVIQYRLQPYKRADGTKGRRVKPYIIDLESSNGTMVNGNKIEPKRYVELFEKDVLKFGFSSREYVLLHEHSKDEPDDDEVGGGSPVPDERRKKE